MEKNFNLALIIDDNEIDSFILERILEDTSFANKVTSYEWAEEALVYLKENDHAEGRIPEFIFLDLNMPIMNGFEFLDHFDKLSERIKSQTKVVMVTTSYHHQDRETALNHPHIYGYILKPVSHDQINLLKQDVRSSRVG